MNTIRLPKVAALLVVLSSVVVSLSEAAISWSGIPTQVNAGSPLSFTVYETVGGPTPPTITLKLNGSIVQVGTQGMQYNGTAPSTAQSLVFNATSSIGGSSSKTVVVVVANTPPIGFFDSLTATVYQGQYAVAQGWAADEEQGAPITRVDVFLNGVDIGDATLGLQRTDVANTYSRPDFTYSGWTYNVATAALPLGNHTVEVRFVDNNGAVTTKPVRTFSVANSTPTTTSCTASNSTVTLGSNITITAATTDPGSELTNHYLEYLPPGSSTWVGASPNWASSGSSYWTGGPLGSHTITATKSLSTVGTWQFRARGRDSANRYSSYKTVSVNVTAASDADGDGMLDTWEVANGLDPTNASDASGDADNDGLTNLQEYQQNLNPQSYDGLAWLEVQAGSIAVPGSGTLVVMQPPYSSSTNISLPAYVKP